MPDVVRMPASSDSNVVGESAEVAVKDTNRKPKGLKRSLKEAAEVANASDAKVVKVHGSQMAEKPSTSAQDEGDVAVFESTGNDFQDAKALFDYAMTLIGLMPCETVYSLAY